MLSQLNQSQGGKPSLDSGGVAPFVVHAFLVWRIASYLTFRTVGGGKRVESGPYGVFDEFRKLIGMTFSEHGTAATDKQPNEVAKVFTCMFCSTTWIGIAVALFTGNGIGYGLALSAAAILLERKILY